MKKTLTFIISCIILITVTACNGRKQLDESYNCSVSSTVTFEPQASSETKLEPIDNNSRLPEIKCNGIEPIITAKKYARLYNKKEWTGSPIYEGKFEISLSHYDEIVVNGKNTGVLTKQGKLYAKVKKKYLNTNWDGTPIKMGNHTVCLSAGGGYILIDGYMACSDECLDFLGVNKKCTNYQYIPGEGTYCITQQKLVKYLKGEFIEISKRPLKWRGFKERDFAYDAQNRLFGSSPVLYYDEVSDKLFLVTADEKSSRYLYVFSDDKSSSIKYIGKYDHCLGSDKGFLYSDPKGVLWRYDREEEQFIEEKEMYK